MATKFSEFTTGATTANTFVVGYDSVADTNNQYSLSQLAAGIAPSLPATDTLYTADGTIDATRVVTLPAAGNIHFQVQNTTASVLSVGYGGGYGSITLYPARPASGSNHRIQAAGVTMLNKYTAGNTLWFGNEVTVNNSYGFNMGAAPNGSSTDVVVIKGQTATDASSSLLIKDSGNVEILRVRDDGVAKFSGQAYTELHDIGTVATATWNNSNVQSITLNNGGAMTLNTPTNPQTGATYILKLIQGASPSTITWTASIFKWPAATAPVLSTSAGQVDIVTLIYDGTNYYGASTINLS